MIIPLCLALPAGGMAVVTAAAVAAAVFITSSGHLGSSPASSPVHSAQTAHATARPSLERGGGSAESEAHRRASLDRRFEAARAEHEAGNHVEAFATLASLADEGHCESARLALQLIHAGPQAYLTSFRAGPKQISRWRGLPGCWSKAVGR